MKNKESSVIDYLNKNGVLRLWNRADTIFSRKTGEENTTLSVSGRVARADNNSKNIAKRIEITPLSGSINNVNLCFCGKNILPNPGTKTASGLTFSYDDDGYLTVNGRASGQIDYYFVGTSNTANGYEYFAPPGKYTFVLERVSGLGDITLYLVASKNTGQTSDGTKVQINNEGQETYELPAGVNCRIMLRVSSGKTVTNLKLKVQAEYGSVYSGYEPPHRESVAIDLKGNVIENLDRLQISEDNSVKIIKSAGSSEIDISADYNFSKLKVPCFSVFNGVRNSPDNLIVEYYSLQLGDALLSNAELKRYLNGQVSSVVGNEPITASNLDTIIDYILNGGGTETAVAASFSIPEQVAPRSSSIESSTKLKITQIETDGITFSTNNFSPNKKCTLKITGSARMFVDGSPSKMSFYLYAYDGSNYTLLGSVTGRPSPPSVWPPKDPDVTLSINSNIEVNSDTTKIYLAAMTNLEGSGVASMTILVESTSNFTITEV